MTLAVEKMERRVLACFLAALAVLGLVGLSSYRHTAAFIGQTRELVRMHAVRAHLEAMAENLAEAQASQLRFIAGGKRKDLERCGDAFFELDRRSAELRPLTLQAGQMGLLAQLEPLLARQVNRVNNALAERSQAQRLLSGEAGRRDQQALAQLLQSLRGRENGLMRSQALAVEGLSTGVLLRLGAGALLALGLLLAAFTYIHREMETRRGVERQLARQSAVLAGVLNGMSDAVLVYGPERELVVANPAALRLLGAAPPRLEPGAPFPGPAHFREDGLRRFAPEELPLWRALRGEPVQDETVYFQGREGGAAPQYFNVSGRPLLDESGRCQGGITVYHDVTALKNEERLLLDENSALESRVEMLKQSNRDRLALGFLVEALPVCRSREEVCQSLLKSLPTFFQHSYGAVYFQVEGQGLLKRVGSWGERGSSKDQFAPEDCWGFRSRRPWVQQHHAPAALCRHFNAPAPAQSVCVPVLVQGEMLAHIEICSDTADPLFMGEERQRSVRVIAEQCGLALANLVKQEQLRDQSIRDPLTRVFNRRHLDSARVGHLSHAHRSGKPMGLLMFDIDFFKQFNDSHGHAAGDHVLQQVSACIQASLRQGDLLFRYGGEEFTALLPGASLEDSMAVAEKVRQAVAGLALNHAGKEMGSPTISVGVACYPDTAKDWEELVQQADAALYQAKRSGRNKSVSCRDLEAPKAA
jgi:diguanylate cyclase (GGDEF)-like protein